MGEGEAVLDFSPLGEGVSDKNIFLMGLGSRGLRKRTNRRSLRPSIDLKPAVVPRSLAEQ